MSIKIGDLVKWFEIYDDFSCTDSGPGIVVEKILYSLPMSTLSLSAYKVYRLKHSDIKMYNNKDVKIYNSQEISRV
jgi:hypothetical protein